MTETLLSIDPGMETGVVLARWSPNERATLLNKWQVTGGLEGFREWCSPWLPGLHPSAVVVEKFSPRPGARSWKLDELEPIRIEGFLTAVFTTINWRRPEQRKLIGTLPRTERFLRAEGYWTVPSEVGRKDANDVNAATMHALGYLRDKAHRPTIDMLIDYGDKMTEEYE